jgi:hypothetical protein
MSKDSVSALVKRATDILFVQNPKGTALGVLFGFILHGLTLIFAPTLDKLSFIDTNKVYTIYYVFLGMFVFNIRSYIKRENLPPKIEERFQVIDRAVKAGVMTKLQAKVEYRKLIQKVLEEVSLPTLPTHEPQPQRKPNRPQLPID